MNARRSYGRVLVTGSGGQLGSELCRILGTEAVGLDLPEFDVTDRDAVFAAVDRHRPAVVVNAAAFTHVDRAEREAEACHAVNVRGVLNLMEACRELGASIVQISTDYVFDGGQSEPYHENDPPNPLNTYGRTKLEAEQALSDYPRRLIVRTAGLFGSGGATATSNFVDTMLRLAMDGRPLRVVADQFSSFTYAGDLARGVLSLLESDARGVFHLTNSGFASWYQLALEAFRLAGIRADLEAVPMAEYPTDAERPRFSVLSGEKYAGILGCFSMPSWQTALATYLARGRGGSSC